MRLFSAIIVSGILVTTNVAWSVPHDEAPQERNAIEWLLSDIGSLFRNAVDAIDQKSASATSTTTQTITDTDAELFAVTTVDPISSPKTSADLDQVAPEPKQSIGGLFENLLAFFNKSAQPNTFATYNSDDDIAGLDLAESNIAAAPALPNVEEPVKTAGIEAPAANRGEIDFFAALNDAAAAYKNDEGIEQANNKAPVLDGFFASLGNIFKGTSPGINAEEIAVARSTQESDKTAQVIDSVKVVAQAQSATNATEQKQVADIASFEPAPWQVFPHVAVFTPKTNIFDKSEAPLAAPIAAQTPKIETIEMAQVEPTIRKRSIKNPVARNHLSLGRTKVAELSEEDPDFFDHLIETFIGEGTSAADQNEVIANKIPDRLVPEENLDLGYIAPNATRDAGPSDELTTIGDSVLKNIDLYLGADTVIGRSYVPNAHQSGTCIERSLQVSVFCVTNIEWPATIASSFAQDTAFTLPGEGVVRYENGRISRVYTPFKANDFADVVKFMQRQFGPPLEREIVWMHMIEAPKMPNTTFRWRAVSADRKDSVVLEVRNFDDLRRSFADLNRGMVRLYRDGSRPIFKHLSTMDLMLIQRRRVSQAPTAPSQDTAAN